MYRAIIALMLGGAFCATSANAAEADFSPGEAGDRFESEAKNFGGSVLSVTDQKCEQKETYTCRFDLTGDLVFFASAPSEDDAVTAAALYFTKDSDIVLFFAGVGVLLAVFDPDITEDERQRIGQKLIDGAPDGGAAEIADGYTIVSTYDQSVGVRIAVDYY